MEATISNPDAGQDKKKIEREDGERGWERKSEKARVGKAGRARERMGRRIVQIVSKNIHLKKERHLE